MTRTNQSSEEFINLRHIFKINTLIVVLSFIAYFTHIGSIGRGNFNGVFNHSNALAPIAALVCIEKVLQYFKDGKKIKHVLIALIAIFIVLLSGARSSLAALVVCLMVIGFYIYRIKFVFFGTGILIIGIIAFFTLKNFNSYLIPEEHLSNRYRSRTIFEKGLDNTRFLIWGERIDEFKAKPFLGSGFSAVNTKVIPEESASYDIETGSIQPGSGYLGVLSMLGVLGFSLFLYIVIYAISNLYENSKYYNNKDFLIIVSILLFVLIHSFFEGYIISSGSILFLIFWLSISYILNKNAA
ncbi:O-antigen ligase family protein [Winogradskyella litorisediminis]|uniref:O-antigen ligase family protein n=1 Tax=Winogradskyella litorisediminis TaxID=1156618 RepID=A0ABW3N6N4_9FLAO